MPTLLAEFKKILTVRSTYVLVLIALFLAGLVTYLGTAPVVYEYVVDSEQKTTEQQIPNNAQQQAAEEQNPPGTIVTTVSHDLPKERLLSLLQDTLPVMAIFFAIVVVLLMAHEFRHNTITYTLTASNSRSKVLLSKIIVSIVFTVVATLLAVGVIAAAMYAAVGIKHLNLPPQDYNWGYVGARLFGYTLGFTLMGLAIITLVRSMVAGVVAIFLLPTIDNIAAALLATRNIEATKFLPFSALSRVNNVMVELLPPDQTPSFRPNPDLLPATVLGATAVFAIYLVGTWIVAWVLFLRRDAS